MNLADRELLTRALEGAPLFMPFKPYKAVDVRSGTSYGLGSGSYDVRLAQDIELEAGGFVLASTIEYFNMPRDCSAVLHDKSTLARFGLALQNTYVDAGFQGYLTLEISNNNRHHLRWWKNKTVRLRRGQPIAQVVVSLMTSKAMRPYAGKYQHQPDRPVGPIQEGH